MPVVYRIEGAKKVIHTQCIENVTFAEVLDHFKILVQDPQCPDRLDVLLDLSETTSRPESYQLREVSYKIGSINDRVQFGACAIVAPNDVVFGMSRMFEVFAERWFRRIGVFRELAEAEAWLQSEEPSINQQSA
jgi:hypothetical protein